MNFIGIDNGISGGIARVRRGILITCVIPTQKTRKGNEIDGVELARILCSLGASIENTTVVCEEPGGSKSAAAAASMASSFGVVRGVCCALRLPFRRITPRQWQKEMLPGVATGQTKPAALTKAKELWPNHNWLATAACRKPHDGMIDAALIAEWAERAYRYINP